MTLPLASVSPVMDDPGMPECPTRARPGSAPVDRLHNESHSLVTELIQPLFDGPVDIVGDVHGEIDALDQLMRRLGYSRDGVHPNGRRLVFVGDLVDRGADSPAVVERVADMVVAGRAQCVLGNHEMSLLLGEAKEGNGWFQSPESDHDRAKGHFTEAVQATSSQRTDFLSWMSSLPLALERQDLRVVHACWDPVNVAAMRGDARSIADIHLDYEQRILAKLQSGGHLLARNQELAIWGDRLTDRDATVPLLNGVATIDSLKQSDHPLKALTSGLEMPMSWFSGNVTRWLRNNGILWLVMQPSDGAGAATPGRL